MSLGGDYRKQVILDEVNSLGKVSARDLAKRLKISKETIRRYLSELEEGNKLKRVYGGAMKLSYGEDEIGFNDRLIKEIDIKEAIARAAAKIIDDNDTIIIDEGTTTLRMIPHINKRNIKIITNSFPIANEVITLIDNGDLDGELIFIGGKVNSRNLRTGGAIAERTLGGLHYHKAFLSCDGLSKNDGITCFNMEKTFLSQRYISMGGKIVLLVDNTKLNRATPYKIDDIENVDIIVCDKAMPKEWRENINKNIYWITAKTLND